MVLSRFKLLAGLYLSLFLAITLPFSSANASASNRQKSNSALGQGTSQNFSRSYAQTLRLKSEIVLPSLDASALSVVLLQDLIEDLGEGQTSELQAALKTKVDLRTLLVPNEANMSENSNGPNLRGDDLARLIRHEIQRLSSEVADLQIFAPQQVLLVSEREFLKQKWISRIEKEFFKDLH